MDPCCRWGKAKWRATVSGWTGQEAPEGTLEESVYKCSSVGEHCTYMIGRIDAHSRMFVCIEGSVCAQVNMCRCV